MNAEQAVILFAHGARDGRWAASLHALAAVIRDRLGEASVRSAFLDLQSPTLPQALAAAAAEGAQRIDILPVFWAGAGHVDKELPPMIADFSAIHPDIRIRTLPVLSALPGMLEFIAEVIDARTPGPSA
jgi:sirohydrochlorin cobaltochelatase